MNAYETSGNSPTLAEMQINKIDCQGLNADDQQRISEIGYDAWLGKL